MRVRNSHYNNRRKKRVLGKRRDYLVLARLAEDGPLSFVTLCERFEDGESLRALRLVVRPLPLLIDPKHAL